MAGLSQEELKKRCDFLFDNPGLTTLMSDLRGFNRGDKICAKMPTKDGKNTQIEIWDYVSSMNLILAYDPNTKQGTVVPANDSDKNNPILALVKKLMRTVGRLSAREIRELKNNKRVSTFHLIRDPKYKNEEVVDASFVGTYNPAAAGGKKKTRKARGRRHKTRRA